MSSTEESLEDLVETIMTSKSEVRRLTMNKSSLHDEYLALNDQVAQEVAKAIKYMISFKAACPVDQIVINWYDARPMTSDIERGEDGKLYVSLKLVQKMAIQMGDGSSERSYLKLMGGGKKRYALNAINVKRFEKAWQDTKELGATASTAPQVMRSLENLAEYSMQRYDDVLAMVDELYEEGIGPNGYLLVDSCQDEMFE